MQDQICKINTELEEQIKQAGEAHKKAIEEQEKVHESLLDIEINSQISLAGGQKTFLSQIDNWGRFDKGTESYIEKQLGDYAKEIGNWKDLRVVTEYVVKNCPKELESILTKKLLTDEEEVTAFIYLKKYGYRFMTEYGPLLSFDSSEKIDPTIKKLLSYSYTDQGTELSRNNLKNKLIKDLTKIIKVNPSIKLLLNVSPQYGNIYIYGKKLSEIMTQNLEQDFDGYYDKPPSKKVGHIVVSKASSYIEDMEGDFVDIFVHDHEHVHQAMEILFESGCKPYKANNQLAKTNFTRVMELVKASYSSRIEAIKAKIGHFDLSEGGVPPFDQMAINEDTVIKLSLAQTKDIKQLLQDIFTQCAKSSGDKRSEGNVANIISIIDSYVDNEELLFSQGENVFDKFSKGLSEFFPNLKEGSIEIILSYLIDIEAITPGPFHFSSRYPEESWDSEAIAHYFEHLAAEIRDPSSKTKLVPWEATGIDKYFTGYIIPEAESFLKTASSSVSIIGEELVEEAAF